MENRFRYPVIISLLTIAACDDGTSNDPKGEPNVLVFDNTQISDDVTFRDVVDNGEELNGTVLNGINLNGINLNGINLNTSSLGGSLDIGAFYIAAAFKVVRSKLEFTDSVGTVVRGNSLAGLEFNLTVDGTNQRLRIESVFADANDPDISYTNLSVRKADLSWTTWCKDDYGNPTEAIVIEGRYDTNGNFLADNGAIAFACRGTASAKCIVWGYKPWDEVNGVSMRDHYQACLAMVRGDYCRTNVAHTVNGTAIDVSDRGLSPAVQVSTTSWPVEAQWGVNGAVCFNTPRKLIYPRTSIDPCYGTVPTCPGSGWAAGTLLQTRANPT